MEEDSEMRYTKCRLHTKVPIENSKKDIDLTVNCNDITVSERRYLI